MPNRPNNFTPFYFCTCWGSDHATLWNKNRLTCPVACTLSSFFQKLKTFVQVKSILFSQFYAIPHVKLRVHVAWKVTEKVLWAYYWVLLDFKCQCRCFIYDLFDAFWKKKRLSLSWNFKPNAHCSNEDYIWDETLLCLDVLWWKPL